MKPKLLIVELWGLGDLIIATPFIQAASEKFDVTVLAKPYAQDIQKQFWPNVTVVPFVAPWTTFTGKYHLWRWSWPAFYRLRRLLKGRFDVGLSARWDPRDHILMAFLGAKRRIGFPRIGSQAFLSHPLRRPSPLAHRYEYWRTLAEPLGIQLPEQRAAYGGILKPNQSRTILIHSGAGQPVRVWPLPRFQTIANRLRVQGYRVQIACDPDQRGWWTSFGEPGVATPKTVPELLKLIHAAAVFIGNDSGPGHLAALSGVPTLSLFGPQNSEWFAPLHPEGEVIQGKPCPYKPCSDYCRFQNPICLDELKEEDVFALAEKFVYKHLGASASPRV